MSQIETEALRAANQLCVSLSPDAYMIIDTWDERCDREALQQRAIRDFHEAYEVIARFFASRPAVLTRGDAQLPEWLSHVECAACWWRDDRGFLLYLIDDEPFITWLYGYARADHDHRLVRELHEKQLVSRIYRLSIHEKVALLDAADTSPQMRLWIFEYARAYPSAVIHEAIMRNQHQQYGDHSEEWVLKAMDMVREEIMLLGDRFPN